MAVTHASFHPQFLPGYFYEARQQVDDVGPTLLWPDERRELSKLDQRRPETPRRTVLFDLLVEFDLQPSHVGFSQGLDGSVDGVVGRQPDVGLRVVQQGKVHLHGHGQVLGKLRVGLDGRAGGDQSVCHTLAVGQLVFLAAK